MAKHRPRERRPLVSTDVWDNDESMTALWHLVHLCKSTNQWLLVRVRCELSAARLATLEHLLQPFVRRRTLGGGANHAPAATCHVWVCLDARQRCQLSYDILANAPKACVVLSPGKVAHVKFNPPPPSLWYLRHSNPATWCTDPLVQLRDMLGAVPGHGGAGAGSAVAIRMRRAVAGLVVALRSRFAVDKGDESTCYAEQGARGTLDAASFVSAVRAALEALFAVRLNQRTLWEAATARRVPPGVLSRARAAITTAVLDVSLGHAVATQRRRDALAIMLRQCVAAVFDSSGTSATTSVTPASTWALSKASQHAELRARLASVATAFASALLHDQARSGHELLMTLGEEALRAPFGSAVALAAPQPLSSADLHVSGFVSRLQFAVARVARFLVSPARLPVVTQRSSSGKPDPAHAASSSSSSPTTPVSPSRAASPSSMAAKAATSTPPRHSGHPSRRSPSPAAPLSVDTTAVKQHRGVHQCNVDTEAAKAQATEEQRHRLHDTTPIAWAWQLERDRLEHVVTLAHRDCWDIDRHLQV